jgi:hypothetical protein
MRKCVTETRLTARVPYSHPSPVLAYTTCVVYADTTTSVLNSKYPKTALVLESGVESTFQHHDQNTTTRVSARRPRHPMWRPGKPGRGGSVAPPIAV